VIQDELEEQTITYLLIRPIPRWALYTVKMLAAVTTTVVLTAIFTAITYAAIYVGVKRGGEHAIARCFHAIGIHCLAVMTYCCLFGLFSLFTKRALVMGILYTAIFEGLLANLPLSVRLITVIYYTRIIAYRTMTFPANTATEAWQLDIANDPKLLEYPDVSTCIWVLLISSLVFTMLGAIICSRREFYVKTPEKN
jgi:ABC-2 type transport system permease protein